MMELSAQQEAVVNAALVPLSVIACAGSGKTQTAIHRLAEIRKRLGAGRGRVALLSFSNIAVDTFRKGYLKLADEMPVTNARNRVEIDTLDAFITKNILHPHASRTMKSKVAAYLVTGNEPFLQGFKFNAGKFPLPISELRISFWNGEPQFYCSYREKITQLKRKEVEPIVCRLGSSGAYTHDLGRYWCYRTLCEQPGILRAFVRRYPHILIDEAQDIGSGHQAILDLLAKAGAQISLIGDPNQGIYEFAGADGGYLKEYANQTGAATYHLSTNYRSVPSILKLANGLSRRNDAAHRLVSGTHHGPFFTSYKKGQEVNLIEAFRQTITESLLEISKSAVICRGRSLLDRLTGGDTPVGQGTTKLLAQAAILRDQQGDYSSAFKLVTIATIALLANPPRDFFPQIMQASRFVGLREQRRAIWNFARNVETGLPRATLPADAQWHPLLLRRMRDFLCALESKFDLRPVDNLGQKLSKKGLPSSALATLPDSVEKHHEQLRIDTVHQVKGESLDAVLYIATKDNVQALLTGTGSEAGRIGYVAVTRAKDLFWLGVPISCVDSFRSDLIAKGLQEVTINEPPVDVDKKRRKK